MQGRSIQDNIVLQSAIVNSRLMKSVTCHNQNRRFFLKVSETLVCARLLYNARVTKFNVRSVFIASFFLKGKLTCRRRVLGRMDVGYETHAFIDRVFKS